MNKYFITKFKYLQLKGTQKKMHGSKEKVFKIARAQKTNRVNKPAAPQPRRRENKIPEIISSCFRRERQNFKTITIAARARADDRIYESARVFLSCHPVYTHTRAAVVQHIKGSPSRTIIIQTVPSFFIIVSYSALESPDKIYKRTSLLKHKASAFFPFQIHSGLSHVPIYIMLLYLETLRKPFPSTIYNDKLQSAT